MATSKKNTEEVTEVVEELELDAPAEVVAEVVETAVKPVTVAPSTAPFTARNTWTAYYGTTRYDFVEGRTYDLAPEVAAWFNRSNI